MSPGNPYVTAFLSVFSQYLAFFPLFFCLLGYVCIHAYTEVHVFPWGWVCLCMEVVGCQVLSHSPPYFALVYLGVVFMYCGSLVEVELNSGHWLRGTFTHWAISLALDLFHLKLRKNVWIWIICQHVCLCTTCIVGAHGSQKRVVATPELQIVVHLHLSAETQAQGNQPILLISEPSLQVLIFNFFLNYIYLCVCKHICVHMPQHTCGSQKTYCGSSFFFPSNF